MFHSQCRLNVAFDEKLFICFLVWLKKRDSSNGWPLFIDFINDPGSLLR